MPATSAVLLVGVIGIRPAAFVAGVWMVVVMSVSTSGIEVIDGDQGQAQVARFLEQPVQRGLVGYGATDDGGAVAVAGDGQPVEPGGPPGIEVALETDLVPSR